MGLEVVEFVVSIERAFGIAIPDADIAAIATPRQFVGYLMLRLREVDPLIGAGGGGIAGPRKQRCNAILRWHMLRPMPSDPAPLVRHVKIFTNGRNQAVRIPREFELPGDLAIMRKEGDRLIIEPAPRKSLLAVLRTLHPIEEAFPEIADPPPDNQET